MATGAASHRQAAPKRPSAEGPAFRPPPSGPNPQSLTPSPPKAGPARATGIEPATTGSTVRYSNQLSYAPKSFLNNDLLTHFVAAKKVMTPV